ncbi:E3 ubiquitin-protein ligase BRE1-like 1 isoform X1 [Zea mays]|uniref:E3 ubiquitin protein ligase n=3 Tax=Zea mays TaxID=4577 RepID=A0A1D6LNS1_MAIZE|nr:E3 ubiquitin-protein ligase BRE1-like 1 isoform X1 [Zea mays]XP_008648894.1 E3 ubiquitin-protein ligase BRE1-like 1 isoform X1 [Zea mays]XP_008648895.1 E3 ubiquitin-protein ligase BRE1-like 1 isoform X1 [Zea mays]XP_008648897.1 E3 ubiquitin-protein ligase BRE1-like 1 isoform X1 [Zea mays]XP_035815889.1 E3 ubiquitin-protein ligase BRE1-like 1 isoform X1 [Zea mays]XP_035815890.1 E3 ubiquitin-protein ligase BRE1-like 1 isoform X1 [Zea mays]XP_035815891.1 E3 ubiquitin-protein ligase BRE1-like |eukprot:XP_008648891.1 E3 ubiquitin-protein ligase BRE1-like 1 isoform X1 [Zea mays]
MPTCLHVQDPRNIAMSRPLDFAVLNYKNQRLAEQLEVHKFEFRALESRFNDLKEKQRTHNETLILVENYWERLVAELGIVPVCKSESSHSSCSTGNNNIRKDGICFRLGAGFLNGLLEAGASATESSGFSNCQLGNDVSSEESTTIDILQKMFLPSSGPWHANNEVVSAALKKLPENEHSRQLHSATNDVLSKLHVVMRAVDNLHLKHMQLAGNYQKQRDSSAWNRAEQKRLKEELTSVVAKLEESKQKLAVLKAQGDNKQATPILVPMLGKKTAEKVGDKQTELQDLEATHKELMESISKRLEEIRRLHTERIGILNNLATFQNILTDFKSIHSSKAFQLVNDQLQKSQAELDGHQTLLEKLQVDMDTFVWRERQFNQKVDLAEISQKVSAYYVSRIADLEKDVQKLCNEKNMLVLKLEGALREPGRNQVISEFKALVSSLPREMGAVQTELSKHKDASLQLHSLRAEVHSLSSIRTRKEQEIEETSRSAHAGSDISQLQSLVHELRENTQELKLFVELYKHDSADSRQLMESRDRELAELAGVHVLRYSLNESKLEQRVIAANEAEAISQQRLATAEAEVAELGQKLETSRSKVISSAGFLWLRNLVKQSDILKSKHEECEAYMVEIESIGHAYEDIMSQNQQLLQQIIERDDHNTKLFMEGVKAKQSHDALHLEVCSLQRNLQHASTLMDLCNQKLIHLEDKLRGWSERLRRLSEDGMQQSISLGISQTKLTGMHGEAPKLGQALNVLQAKVGSNRLEVAELLIELETERFSKKRLDDDLDLMSSKASSLREKADNSQVLQKLLHEAKEYRGILKCGICHDRQKEVVIAKCYHLFCNQCIQKSLGSRQKRCPSCGLSFGVNDVKPIYI